MQLQGRGLKIVPLKNSRTMNFITFTKLPGPCVYPEIFSINFCTFPESSKDSQPSHYLGMGGEEWLYVILGERDCTTGWPVDIRTKRLKTCLKINAWRKSKLAVISMQPLFHTSKKKQSPHQADKFKRDLPKMASFQRGLEKGQGKSILTYKLSL